jgi:hypothetical protein
MTHIRKTDDQMFPYIDNEGCSWESIEDWLFIGILGGCGCGSGNSFGENVLELLNYFGTPHQQRDMTEVNPYDGGTYELLAHWMDSKDLLEHGSSIGGSWLAERGKEILHSALNADL